MLNSYPQDQPEILFPEIVKLRNNPPKKEEVKPSLAPVEEAPKEKPLGQTPKLLNYSSSTNKLFMKIVAVVLLTTIASIFSILFLQSAGVVVWIIPILASGLVMASVRYFLSPLRKITEGVNLFSRKEFDHRIEVDTKDEFGSIASELNDMARQLNGHTEKVSEDKDILVSQKNRLDLIFSSLSDGVIVLDLNNRIILANSSTENLTGYTKEELVGQKIEDIISLVDKDAQVVNFKDLSFTKTDDTVNLIGKNKGSHPVKVICKNISGENSLDLGCILILTDRTSQKELESIQLDFVSMASHELRTPLTSVIGYLSIFLKENNSVLSDHQKDFLNRIFIAAQQLGSIIDNLLSVSKVERGALSLSAAPLDWRALLEKVVKETQLQAAQKNITLSLKLPQGELPKISGDEIRLTEVLNNLIANAINYSGSGGTIEVGCRVEGEEIITSVKDTGIGIPPDAMAHLFTKFFRVSGALDKSSNSKGTGLGLYISRSIVELHHGRIWAESELNKGSIFYFSLPTQS